MIQSSTSDSLLLLAYGELPESEASALREQIASDPVLAAEWDAIRLTIDELSATSVSPSETSTKIVLEHSCKTEHLQDI
ncbi:MAG: hypothetical protein JSS76_06405 [Bacteroidetes bacterium]|nr:hypothetical protein [Bacteroidota bacterium]MBS1684365.1 hypothetical protein [Bacteroidota bacterium]